MSVYFIDVWTGVCLTFVFGALLEFALVNYASRNDQHRAAVIKQRKQWEEEQAAALQNRMKDGDAPAVSPVTPNKPLTFNPFDKNRKCYPRLNEKYLNVGFIVKIRAPFDVEGRCPLHFGSILTPGCSIKTWLSRFPSRSKRIDVIARIIFPLLFAFFNVAYWCAYVLRKEDPESLID